jgi:hypothetical protein
VLCVEIIRHDLRLTPPLFGGSSRWFTREPVAENPQRGSGSARLLLFRPSPTMSA